MLPSTMSRFFIGPSSFVLLSIFLACSPAEVPFNEGFAEDMGQGPGGGSRPDGMGTPPPTPCGAEMACAAGYICYQNVCVFDRGPCCKDDDCENDSHCTVSGGSGQSCGHCIDYRDGDYDSMCIGNGFSAYQFMAPSDRCHWPPPGYYPPATNVVMTPIVIDLNADGQPEILFAPQPPDKPARLVAIRGTDCVPLYDVEAGLQNFSQIAAADLDGDLYPEIIGVLASDSASTGHLVAVIDGRTGRRLAQSSEPFRMMGAGFDCSGPAVADIDGDGHPEIVIGGMVLRWNKAAGRIDKVWNNPVVGATWGTLSLVNDFDGDGRPEVVSGTRIFDGLTGADKTPSVMSDLSIGGYSAVGDFNKDGVPDLVFIQSAPNNQRVAVVDVKNNKFLLEPMLFPTGWGGPPTVADFDGDGLPDFGSAGPRNYFVFSLACLADPKPSRCRGSRPGLLWQSQTKDETSGGTASSVFDFNGDGRAEVVYRDECWLRVYNGPDGQAVFARPITSGTALEMPVVADVDNDGHADLIVPSDSIKPQDYCMDQSPEHDTGIAHTGPTTGVFVLKDPLNRWMPSRPLWNQHTYHITNVNDDTTVPAHETPNWSSFNNYRQNIQGSISIPVAQSDVTGRSGPPLSQDDCSKQWTLSAEVCNRGAAAITAKVPATFYRKDPRIDKEQEAICTAFSSEMIPIPPGQCQRVKCNWLSPPSDAVDLWLRVNDDGKGASPQTQCKQQNDLAFLPAQSCRGPA